MRLIESFLTRNDCYQTNRKIIPRGVMVHSTAANNTKISRYVQPDDGILGVNPNHNDWNVPNFTKCVHAFIGTVADGSVATYQTLPWNHRGWHGGGASNNTHIGFEICEDGLTDSNYFNLVYTEAVELVAMLCQMYGLDPLADGVVICHSEGYSRGIASNHGDVMHWFPTYGKSMDTFRQDVYAKMNESEEEVVTYEQFKAFMLEYRAELQDNDQSDYSKEATAWAIANGYISGGGTTETGEANMMYEDFLTREQFAVVLHRFAMAKGLV